MAKKIYRILLIATVIFMIASVFAVRNIKPGPANDAPPDETSLPVSSPSDTGVTNPPHPTTLPPATGNATVPAPVAPAPPVSGNVTSSTTPSPAKSEPVTILARNLEIPWSLDFLPDGSIIFTERPGRVRIFNSKNGLLETLLTIDEVAARGEGGLLGIAVHPDFAANRFVYVYHTYQGPQRLANRVVRYRMQEDTLALDKVIIDNIPAASIHDGGRIKFGPDGLLYITAGDAAQPELAQNTGSLAGEILRLKDDGSIPADNPFPGSPVYSYGHRNPQGLAWDNQGRLWETEHGQSAHDELNLIEPGKNYGWPTIRGDETAPGMERPVLHSGDDTWAPSGLAFLDGSLYFTGLRGQSLYQVVFLQALSDRGEWSALRRHLTGEFGRLRDVVVGPDNLLYVLTNDRDGRGTPDAGDDLILRVAPEQLVP